MVQNTVKKAAEEFRAIASTGSIVKITPEVMLGLISRMNEPLIIECHKKRFYGGEYSYLTSYKGLCFYTEAKSQLAIPTSAEIIMASEMWIPRI